MQGPRFALAKQMECLAQGLRAARGAEGQVGRVGLRRETSCASIGDLILMSIDVHRDDVRKRFIATAAGTLNLPDLLSFMSSHRVGSYQEYTLLFDTRAASFDLSAAQVRSMADNVGSLLRREGTRGRTALVATNDELYGLARMFQIVSDDAGVSTIAVFRELSAAERWLDGIE
jgi:hypothetical protein